MPKITGPKPKIPSAKAHEAKAATRPESKPAAKSVAKFPRTGWSDSGKLAKTIEHARTTSTHPRLVHAHTHKDPIGGEPTRPPIMARYGLPAPHPGPHPQPPIVARYGLPAPHPAPHPGPPIVARYGLPAPHPQPPIVARYGLPAPHPAPHPGPPIVARYGLPAPHPRPGHDTSPRSGIQPK